MTTLAADKPRGFEHGEIVRLPVVASDIIYAGSALGWSSGEVRPLVAGDKFAGFSLEQCDNSAGAAAAKFVAVRRAGFVLLPITGDAEGDEGAVVYASDDDTFTLEAEAGNTPIGVFQRYDASGLGVVSINPVDLERELNAGGVPATATFTIGAEAANAITVSIQLKDANGEDLDRSASVWGYLSEDSAGADVEPVAATTTITHGDGAGDGTVMTCGAANAQGHHTFLMTSEADGDIDIKITESAGANTFYLVLVMPNGKKVISDAITFAA